MEVCDLMLQTGADIPFIPLAITIHQPTIKEIGLIGGEETFYKACQLIQLTKKDLINKEDIKDLDKIDDFEIIMMMINSDDPQNLTYKIDLLKLFALLFPNCSVDINRHDICLKEEGSEQEKKLTKNNFNEFKKIIDRMFLLKNDKQEYNPSGELAAQIAKKFEERKKKLQEQSHGDKDHFDIFSRYISILNIGLGLDKNSLSNYTVYQLFDTFNRYQLYHQYDLGIRIQLAGGKTNDFPDGWQDWMKRIE